MEWAVDLGRRGLRVALNVEVGGGDIVAAMIWHESSAAGVLRSLAADRRSRG
jgi:hypothetical protein